MELTLNPEIIVLANSSELELDFDSILMSLRYGTQEPIYISCATIDWIAGSPKFSSNGQSVTSSSGGLSSSITKLLLPIERGVKIKVKGSTNDSFQITIQNNS